MPVWTRKSGWTDTEMSVTYGTKSSSDDSKRCPSSLSGYSSGVCFTVLRGLELVQPRDPTICVWTSPRQSHEAENCGGCIIVERASMPLPFDIESILHPPGLR